MILQQPDLPADGTRCDEHLASSRADTAAAGHAFKRQQRALSGGTSCMADTVEMEPTVEQFQSLVHGRQAHDTAACRPAMAFPAGQIRPPVQAKVMTL